MTWIRQLQSTFPAIPVLKRSTVLLILIAATLPTLAQSNNPRMPTHIGLGGSNTHAGFGVLVGAPILDTRFGVIAGVGVVPWLGNPQPTNPVNATVALQYRFTHQWYMQVGYAPIAMQLWYRAGRPVENRILNGPTIIGGYDFTLNDAGTFGLSLGLGVGAVFRTVEKNLYAPTSTIGVFWVLTD